MVVTERMKHFNIPGVSVTHFADGEISWSKHFGTLEKGTGKTVDDNSIFHACSMSKMITAICVLRLTQSGKLDLHKDVNEYLTSWKIPDNEFTKTKKVTLANLLAHQAGLVDIAGSFNPYKDGDSVPSLVDILKGATSYSPKEVNIKYEPETTCQYSDAGYCIINQVLIDVLGESIPQAAEWIIFKPLKLSRTFFWEMGRNAYDGISIDDCAVGHNKHGHVVKEVRATYPNIEGAALWTTTRELASIIIDLLKSYHGKDGLVLNQEMARRMLTPYGCDEHAGLGVFLFLNKDNETESYFMSQGWGVGMQCKLRTYIEGQSGVIVMTNSDPGLDQSESLVGEIIKYVCNANGTMSN
ncbi:MAG: beta-lactamase family protein [Defluviitaleaceae bacterium]|nr:beta-lactamase family protein [Defluviitaleaceae bacterium]